METKTLAKLERPRIAPGTQLLDRLVLPGMLCFTRLGHVTRGFDALRENLAGRRIVITGATSGLGLATAHRLAAMQADLVLVGRDPDKLARTAQAIADARERLLPQTECADLALMEQVRALARRLLADPAPIHVLINNAGALFSERALTDEGNERGLAINLLAPYLLTNLLIPRLIASAPARIVNVSSGGMYTQRIHVDDLQYEHGEYDGAKAYARAKRGLVIATGRWAGELADKNVAVHAMHPGWADTPGIRTSLPGFFTLTRPVLRTAEEGADTIVWLAAAGEAAASTGGFWLDRRPHLTEVLPGTDISEDERGELWAALDALTQP